VSPRQANEERQRARALLAAAYHLLLGDVVPDARLTDAHDAAADGLAIVAKLRAGKENVLRAA
jgi:hypothetical protein